MGLDVVFWAPMGGDDSRVDIEAVQKLPGFCDRRDRDAYLNLGNSHWAEYDRAFVVIHSFWRYAGPYYERGHWPQIKKLAQQLTELMPGLHYTNDCHMWMSEDNPGGVACDEQWYKEMDALWAKRVEANPKLAEW
jgi:hypothetical protein